MKSDRSPPSSEFSTRSSWDVWFANKDKKIHISRVGKWVARSGMHRALHSTNDRIHRCRTRRIHSNSTDYGIQNTLEKRARHAELHSQFASTLYYSHTICACNRQTLPKQIDRPVLFTLGNIINSHFHHSDMDIIFKLLSCIIMRSVNDSLRFWQLLINDQQLFNQLTMSLTSHSFVSSESSPWLYLSSILDKKYGFAFQNWEILLHWGDYTCRFAQNSRGFPPCVQGFSKTNIRPGFRFFIQNCLKFLKDINLNLIFAITWQ